MKLNSYLNHFRQLLFYTIPPSLDQYNLFWSYKMDAKTAPWAPKLGYFDGRAPQLSARVHHVTQAAGVIGHFSLKIIHIFVCSTHKCLILNHSARCLRNDSFPAFEGLVSSKMQMVSPFWWCKSK